MNDNEKQHYFDAYEEEKKVYTEELEKYIQKYGIPEKQSRSKSIKKEKKPIEEGQEKSKVNILSNLYLNLSRKNKKKTIKITIKNILKNIKKKSQLNVKNPLLRKIRNE